MHDPKERQYAFNAETRDRWDTFTSHRANVTALLAADGDPGKTRLCILGAGNCNDLDLPTLLNAHREVHLVDLDAEALADGVSRQGVADHPGLRTYGGVDVSGMLDTIGTWSAETSIGPGELSACAEEPARRGAAMLPGPFDVVASTCLLTQLIGSVVAAVGERHPRFLELVRAVREGHLRLLARLAAPGGTLILITDLVSSDTLPSLRSTPEGSLAGLLGQVARDRNFFHGVSPAALWSMTVQHPALAAELLGLDTAPPWRWDLGPRLYLVWALRWRKRA